MEEPDRLWPIECAIREATSTAGLISIMRKYKDNLTVSMWVSVFRSKFYSPKIVKEFEDIFPWNYVSTFQVVEESYLEKHFDEFDMFEISCFYPLSLNLIKKHYHQLSIDKLITNDRLEKNSRDFVNRLYRKIKDDPSFHKRWDENLRLSIAFSPKDFDRRYTDYNENTPFPSYSEHPLKEDKPEKQNIINNHGTKQKEPKKALNEEKYLGKSKADLKAILAKRKIRVYYHDTLEILRRKCMESEE